MNKIVSLVRPQNEFNPGGQGEISVFPLTKLIMDVPGTLQPNKIDSTAELAWSDPKMPEALHCAGVRSNDMGEMDVTS
jgi:hypothetical protein